MAQSRADADTGMSSEKSNELQVIEMSAAYGRGTAEFRIFQDVSFDVAGGEILAIFGPNGCGKSTLLKTLLGLTENFGGRVIQGQMPLQQRQIGYIPQDFRESFFPWTSLYGNVALAKSDVTGHDQKVREIVDEARNALSVGVNFELRPGECSGGMLQQSAIVRALATEPSLVVADEPFSALDYVVARTLRKRLKAVLAERGIPMVVVLHSIQDIMEIADRVLVIPAMPFTTGELVQLPRAELIKNKHQSNQKDGDASGFIAMAKEMLCSNA
jgi:NitT/TauT family transport system ATP-binding protein